MAENLLHGPEAGFFMNRKAMEKEATEVLGRIGFDIDPARSTGSLTAAEMRMLTLATLFHHNYRLIILDEPTARLSGREREILFDLIRTFREKGIAVVYISHRLAEVKLLCDRATIMREGKVVRTLEKDEIDEELMTRLMVNRAASDLAITNPGHMRSALVLGLDKVSTDALKPFSTKVYAGEIPGVTGPVGGAIKQIYEIILQIAEDGGAIIVFSTALEELLALTDRIMVIHDGKVWIEGRHSEFNMDSLLGHILGQRIEKADEHAEFVS